MNGRMHLWVFLWAMWMWVLPNRTMTKQMMVWIRLYIVVPSIQEWHLFVRLPSPSEYYGSIELLINVRQRLSLFANRKSPHSCHNAVLPLQCNDWRKVRLFSVHQILTIIIIIIIIQHGRNLPHYLPISISYVHLGNIFRALFWKSSSYTLLADNAEKIPTLICSN